MPTTLRVTVPGQQKAAGRNREHTWKEEEKPLGGETGGRGAFRSKQTRQQSFLPAEREAPAERAESHRGGRALSPP